MYWWDIKSLKAVLAEGPLPSRMAVQYVLAHALLAAVGFTVSSDAPATPQIWFLRAGTLVITTLGILYCYRRNGAGEGRSFMDRYFAILWVVYVRWFAPVVAFFLFEAVVLLGVLPAHLWPLVTTPSILLAVAALYWRVGVHLADLEERSREQGRQAAPQHHLGSEP